MLRRKRQAAKTETAQSNNSVGTSLHRSSYYGIISGKTILINIQIIPIFELDFDVICQVWIISEINLLHVIILVRIQLDCFYSSNNQHVIKVKTLRFNSRGLTK